MIVNDSADHLKLSLGIDGAKYFAKFEARGSHKDGAYV